MGTADEEARARLEQELRGMEARKDFAARQQEAAVRQAAADAAEQEAAEDALVNGDSKMVADAPAAVAWPDGPTRAPGLGKVAGALRVGRAGDMAFARDLLSSGQTPLGSASAPEPGEVAKESTAGSRAAAKPVLGLG